MAKNTYENTANSFGFRKRQSDSPYRSKENSFGYAKHAGGGAVTAPQAPSPTPQGSAMKNQRQQNNMPF